MKKYLYLALCFISLICLSGCVDDEVEVNDIFGQDYGVIDYKDAPTLVTSGRNEATGKYEGMTINIRHNDGPTYKVVLPAGNDEKFTIYHATGKYFIQVEMVGYLDPIGNTFEVGQQIIKGEVNKLFFRLSGGSQMLYDWLDDLH